MALSSELIDQLVKVTQNTEPRDKDNTAYGTVVIMGSKKYVKIDGSDLMTPVSSTVAVENGDRVIVTIKSHSATVTGNTSSPAASDKKVTELGTKISDFEIVIADKVSAKELDVQIGRIDDLTADNATIKESLTANKAKIDDLTAKNAEITGTLEANKAKIDDLDAKKLDAEVADIKYASVDRLDATDANLRNLKSDYAQFEKTTTGELEATNAKIDGLDTKYANVDFSNIGKAAIERFYATSGIIKDLVVGDQTITGELVGITITGDLIKGNTIVADKLVIKGSDGLYYKLNTDGVTTEKEQTEYNSLNGQIIQAKSITATKIDVKDLVAFGATIGGFNIGQDSIFSGVKETVDNKSRGIYMDKNGQIAIGDVNNYIKYFKDTDGRYRLKISAASLEFNASGDSGEESKDLETVIKDINDKVDGIAKTNKGIGSIANYYLATSESSGVTTETAGWTTKIQNVSSSKKYLWNYEVTKYTDDTIANTTEPCIIGMYSAVGATGNGIQKITEYYALSALKDSVPTVWSENVPNLTATNKYLWNYEKILYTNGGTELTKKRIIGVYGDTGKDGAKGEDGKGIKSTAVTYQASTSGTVIPTGTWQTSIPTVSAGQYLWTRTVITYTDDSKSTSYSVGRMGTNGTNGTNGSAGRGIKSTAITYQAGSSGTTAPTGTWQTTVPATSASSPYLWTRTIITYTDDTTSTSYAVGSTLEGVSVGGRNLLPKTHKTAVTYKYPTGTNYWDPWNSATTVPLNGDTYTLSFWAKSTVDGDKIIVHFYNPSNIISGKSSQGVTISYGDGRCPFMLSTTLTKYWVTYKIPAGGNSTRNIIIPRLYGPDRGETEKGTGEITVQWEKLEEGNIATDWMPAPEDGIASVDVEYYLSTSATALSGGSWSTTAPTWVNGKYMWSRTVTTDGAGNKTYSPNQNGVCIAGAKGETGNDGKNALQPKRNWSGTFTTIGETANVSTSSFNRTPVVGDIFTNIDGSSNTGTWEITKIENGNAFFKLLSYVSSKGATGATGATGKGVTSIVEQYYKSTSATALSGGSWGTTYPGWESGKYIWTRSVITYTDKTTTTTTAVCVTGTKGSTGNDGKTSYVHIAYANIAYIAGENETFTLTSSTVCRYGKQDKWVYKTLEAGAYTGNTTLFGSDPAIGVYKEVNKITDFSISDSSGRAYMGQYTDFEQAGSNDISKYVWTKVQGAKGDTGTKGAPGKDANQVVHSVHGNGNTNQYIEFATVKVIRNYANYATTFKISGREYETTDVQFSFVSVNSTDPGLNFLRATGGFNVWMYKKTTSTWGLVTKLNEAWGRMRVYNFRPDNESISLTWTDTRHASLPSGCIAADQLQAAKTATNFMEFTSGTGLQIGDKTNGTWKGFRSRITSTAFEILNEAGAAVASYGRKLIQLGKDTTDAVIELCGGKGIIKYENVWLYGGEDDTLTISAENMAILADKNIVIRAKRVTADNIRITNQLFMSDTNIHLTMYEMNADLPDEADDCIAGIDIDKKYGINLETLGVTDRALTGVSINGRSLLNHIYPVGSIYMSTSATNPTNFFGGTWVAWGAGRVPVGFNGGDGNFNSSEKTGGSKTINIEHNHGLSNARAAVGRADSSLATMSYTSGGNPHNVYFDREFSYYGGISGGSKHATDTSLIYGNTNNGGSTAASVLQPYITCYMWKRTA